MAAPLLCSLASMRCRWRLIKSPIAQHRKEHIAASAGQSDKRLIVPLALADLAVAVSPGDGIAQRREGRQEHRPLQDLVASS